MNAGGAVWLRFRAEAKRRWRAWLAMGALAGLASGVVVAALAGADRTDTAYDEFLASTEAFDVVIQGSDDVRDLRTIAQLPQVAEAGLASYVPLDDATGDSTDLSEVDPLLPHDGQMYGEFHRPRVLEGRRPDPRRPDEIAITPTVADALGLEPGDVVRARTFAPAQIEAIFGGEPAAGEGPLVELRVVGVEIAASEFLESANAPAIHLSPAFHNEHRDDVLMVAALAVRLRNGTADVNAFKRAVERLHPDLAAQYLTQAPDAKRVNETLDLQAGALRLFAAVAAGAALLVIGQALTRHASVNAGDDRVLRALGMGRLQVVALVVLRAVVVAAVAGVIGFVIGMIVAPSLSFGLARRALLDTGVRVDAELALMAGAVVLVVLLLGIGGGVRAAVRGVRVRGAPARPSRVASAAASAGLSPPAVAGVRFALEPGARGIEGAPVRSALTGAAVAVAAMTTAIVFGASLDHLFSTPRLYGWDWDVVYGNPYVDDRAAEVAPVLNGAEQVAGWASIGFSQAEVGGLRTQALGFERGKGEVIPPVIEGRAPQRPDEVLLGTRTMRDVDVDIGDRIDLAVGDHRVELAVVGRGVLPSLGQYDVAGLGEGALVTLEGLRSLVPQVPRNLFATRFVDGLDVDEGLRALDGRVPADVAAVSEAPKEVADFGRVDAMPTLLAVLLGAVGTATLVHLMAVVVRRRRRETAILKTLGLVRRQVGQAVAWQATTLALTGVLLGVPVGVVVGRAVWRAFADGLGVVPEPTVPVTVLAAVAIAAVVVANLAALAPARIAGATPAAVALRSE